MFIGKNSDGRRQKLNVVILGRHIGWPKKVAHTHTISLELFKIK